MKEETKGAVIFNTVQLTAENDPNRYIQISVVKIGDKKSPLVVDYPHSYLTENEIYAYYYSGGGDDAGKPGVEDQKYFDIAKEVKAISETFKIATSVPLSYSTNGVPVTVSITTAPFGYTAELLKSASELAGKKNETGYFDKLIAKFNGTTKTIYTFQYTGASQDSGKFIITLIPNKAGYTSLGHFKKDFDIYDAGGPAYPNMLNSNWLLFVNACGSGFDDGSGRPNGCDEIRKVVEPTLKLN